MAGVDQAVDAEFWADPVLAAHLCSPKLAFSWSLYHLLLCLVDHLVVTLTDLMFSFFRSLSISPFLLSFSFFNCAEIHTM